MDKQTINTMSRSMPVVVDLLTRGDYRHRRYRRALGLYKLSGGWKRIKLLLHG